MKKRAFDRDDIDHMQTDKRSVEFVRDVKCVGLRSAGVFGGIDADQDFFNHRLPRVTFRDTMTAGRGSRGVGAGEVSKDE